MKGEKKMEENVMIVPDEEIGVDELEENLTGEGKRRAGCGAAAGAGRAV